MYLLPESHSHCCLRSDGFFAASALVSPVLLRAASNCQNRSGSTRETRSRRSPERQPKSVSSSLLVCSDRPVASLLFPIRGRVIRACPALEIGCHIQLQAYERSP